MPPRKTRVLPANPVILGFALALIVGLVVLLHPLLLLYHQDIPSPFNCALEGDIECIKQAIRDGFDPNTSLSNTFGQGYDGYDLLQLAVLGDHEHVVSYLLQYDIDLERRNIHGQRAIDIAVEQNQAEIVNIIRSHGD